VTAELWNPDPVTADALEETRRARQAGRHPVSAPSRRRHLAICATLQAHEVPMPRSRAQHCRPTFGWAPRTPHELGIEDPAPLGNGLA
jgi:hypothetical protein